MAHREMEMVRLASKSDSTATDGELAFSAELRKWERLAQQQKATASTPKRYGSPADHEFSERMGLGCAKRKYRITERWLHSYEGE